MQSALYGKRAAIRTELAYRADFDDGSPSAPNEDWFGDVLASVGVVIPLGPPVVAAPPAPVAPSCADLDDDGDGVNNCDDKCPGSQAGQTIGPDGCPVPVSIDLKGVNFDFDKATLRSDAVSILTEATEILKRYPELKVEVAGHTDQCGKDAYNQKLSERRAKAVYDYLTSNGVDAAPSDGPERLRREPSARGPGPGVPGLQEREEPSHRAERPELARDADLLRKQNFEARPRAGLRRCGVRYQTFFQKNVNRY